MLLGLNLHLPFKYILCVIGMVKAITGGYKVTYHPDATDTDKGKPVEIDFTPPFRRSAMLPELQKVMGITFPELDLSSPGDCCLVFKPIALVIHLEDRDHS